MVEFKTIIKKKTFYNKGLSSFDTLSPNNHFYSFYILNTLKYHGNR